MLKQQKEVLKGSPIATLTPYLDREGLIRVGGRINNATIPYEQKHPVIIPASTDLAKLIIQDAHISTLHGGITTTIAYIRKKYWIPQLKKSARAAIRRCTTCTRFNAETAVQLMGQLPKERVTPSRPFAHTGIDYAGPIDVRTSKGRGHKCAKG